VYVPAIESEWDEALADVVRTVAASWVSGSALAVLADRALAQGALGSALSCLAPVRFVAGEGEVAHTLTALRLQRIRVLGQVSDELLAAANEAHVYLARERPQKSGRLELLFHLLEQSVSVTTHRYGHLGLHEVSARH
jgi:hypothetical protein